LWVSFAPGSGHGYGYIFPKRDYVNVGVGYLVSSFKTTIRAAPHALHEAFVLASKRAGSSKARPTGRASPLSGARRRPAAHDGTRRVYVAGDAGGFVNGFSAEGIYFAMVTGDLAPRRFSAARRRDCTNACAPRDRRRDARCALPEPPRVRRPGARGRLVRGVRAYPPVAQLLVDYATGADTYEGVRRRFLLKFP